MAAKTESDDASDLFWPGYVDAVTNLAINLLFVIAVMSIVVIGITLQISQMTKKKSQEEPRQQHTEISTQPQHTASSSAAELEQMQQLVEQYRKQLEQVRKQLTHLQSQQPVQSPAETVEASQNKPKDTKSPNSIESLSSPAVVIVFSRDVVTLSPSEVAELIGKLRKFSPLTSGRWEVSVISPKGLSEAVRLAYYRANAARNALLENGVNGQAIDMRIHESTQATADNSKVLVRWMP